MRDYKTIMTHIKTEQESIAMIERELKKALTRFQIGGDNVEECRRWVKTLATANKNLAVLHEERYAQCEADPEWIHNG